LTHENIARVFDLGWDGDRYFVTGELLEDAETLQNVLEALSPERLERDEVDAIVGAIGAALAHAHAKGVVHGDVRAENVLVSDGHVKLANFVPTSLARKTSGVAEPTDDIRALANLADELYFDGIKVTPQPRAKATEPPPRNRNRGTPPRPLEILDEAGGGILWHRRAPIRPQTARRPIGFLTACLVVLAALGVLAMAFRGQDAAPLLDAPQIQEIRDWMAQGPGGSSPELAARTEVAALAEPRELPPQLDAEPRHDPLLEKQGSDSPTRAQAVAPKSSGRPELALSARSVTAREDEGAVSIDIVRSGDTSVPVHISWRTRDGTAHGGDDYASFGRSSESLRAGETRRTLYIPIASDALPEGVEHFYLHLDPEPSGAAVVGIAMAQITVIDDDR
jgi:hypothetical protein